VQERLAIGFGEQSLPPLCQLLLCHNLLDPSPSLSPDTIVSRFDHGAQLDSPPLSVPLHLNLSEDSPLVEWHVRHYTRT
jgi:hypothetical protein